MANYKVELNADSVRELMQSQEMMDLCTSIANQALASLGDGYEVTTLVGKTRVNAEIAAVTYKAKKENSKTNSILKAIGGVHLD